MSITETISSFFQRIISFFDFLEKQKLETERKKILDEIRLTEKKMFKGDISKEAYAELNGVLHRKLIAIDAEISVEKINARVEKMYAEKGLFLREHRNEKLKQLLRLMEKEKQEIHNAKKLFLKRKINAKDYESITKEKQFKIIDFEAEINSLYREEARDIMKDTERKLSMSEKEAADKKAEEIVEDVFIETIEIPEKMKHEEIPKPISFADKRKEWREPNLKN